MILQHIGVLAPTALLEYFPFPAYSSLREIDHLVVFLVVPLIKNASMGDTRTVVSLRAKKLSEAKGSTPGDVTIDIIAEISIRFLKVAITRRMKQQKKKREKNNVHIFTIHEER